VLWGFVERVEFKEGQSRSLYREDLCEAENCWIKRVGAYGTELGVNETSGGKGTTDIIRSAKWIEETRQRKRNLYKNADQRHKQSAAKSWWSDLPPLPNQLGSFPSPRRG